MAPLWWVTLYGGVVVMFLGTNWINYFGGVGISPSKGLSSNSQGGHKVCWKW